MMSQEKSSMSSSSADYCRLLALPIELRFLLYDSLLRSPSGRVQLAGPNFARHLLLGGLGLLAACKQLHNEAYQYLTTTNTCQLKFPEYGARIAPNIKTALTHFKHVDIHIRPSWDVEPPGRDLRMISHDQPVVKVNRVIQLLNAAYRRVTEPQVSVRFIFKHQSTGSYNDVMQDPSLGLLHPLQAFKDPPPQSYTRFSGWQAQAQARAAFHQVQIAHMMAEMRPRLKCCNVTITTNADRPVAGVETVRVNERTMKFRIREHQKKGVIEVITDGLCHDPREKMTIYDTEPL